MFKCQINENLFFQKFNDQNILFDVSSIIKILTFDINKIVNSKAYFHIKAYKMNCVSIVYKHSSHPNITHQGLSLKPVKKSVDDYYQKLQQKQQPKILLTQQPLVSRSSLISAAQNYRSTRIKRQMVKSLNIFKVQRAISHNSIKKKSIPSQYNGQQSLPPKKTQRKFRSTVSSGSKKKGQIEPFSFKGLQQLKNTANMFQFINDNPISHKDDLAKHSKVKSLKKFKSSKKTTILISIDFILNQKNFWEQQNIEDSAQKYWKKLQQHCNIVWLVKRQNSLKKLQKFANDNSLRVDGIYQIVSNKNKKCLTYSLHLFQKDFNLNNSKNQNSMISSAMMGVPTSQKNPILLSRRKKSSDIASIKQKEINFQKSTSQILIFQGLNVQSIQSLNHNQFLDSFPVSKSLKCNIHFVQIDINDKQRFNLPLKILSKQKLPHPNSIEHIFKTFQQENKSPCKLIKRIKQKSSKKTFFNQLQQPDYSDVYQGKKSEIIQYFTDRLKIGMNTKIQMQQNSWSLQYLIGDMLKRNFKILATSYKQSIKINRKIDSIKKQKLSELKNSNAVNSLKNNFIRNQEAVHTQKIESLINSKLGNNNVGEKHNQIKSSQYYRFPVYIWKK